MRCSTPRSQWSILAAVPADDVTLLTAWRAGDRASGGELFERYYPAVVRFFANKISGDPTDLVQETFMACLDGQARIRDPARFRPFLFGIAYNRLKLYFERNRKEAEAIDYSTQSAADLSPGPSTVMAKGAERRLLLAALRRIPVEHQVVLELFYWEELTSAAIAEALGEPHGTVRTRIRRARQLLDAAIDALDHEPGLAAPRQSGLEGWAAAVRGLLKGLPAIDG